MKLATLKDRTRDGKLLIVSRDLSRAVVAGAHAPTLQNAIETWTESAPRLQALSDRLNSGHVSDAFPLDLRRLAAPFPRAYQWLDASAFHSHGNLMQKALNVPRFADRDTIPLMYQGGSDDFLGAHDDVPLLSEEDGIDFEAEVAVVVDDVKMGTRAPDALRHVQLLMLVNDVSLRAFSPREVKTGFGFLQAKPSTSFAPVAVTPDELGEAWRDARVHLPVHVFWNGREFGRPNAGAMGFGFHQLIEHAARTRNLRAGTIIGSGTVSNENYAAVGSACISERRGIEILEQGKASTGYMKFGDTVRIEVCDGSGASVFGAIDQRIVQTGHD